MEHEETQTYNLQSLILSLFHRCMAVNYSRYTDLGIHPRQFPFLKVISMVDGISQRDLANALHVKPPTVAVTVKRLEKAELIYRKTDPGDQRISRIYLSEKGKTLTEEVEQEISATEDVLEQGFSAQELDQLKEFLSRMVSNFDRYQTTEGNKRQCSKMKKKGDETGV